MCDLPRHRKRTHFTPAVSAARQCRRESGKPLRLLRRIRYLQAAALGDETESAIRRDAFHAENRGEQQRGASDTRATMRADVLAMPALCASASASSCRFTRCVSGAHVIEDREASGIRCQAASAQGICSRASPSSIASVSGCVNIDTRMSTPSRRMGGQIMLASHSCAARTRHNAKTSIGPMNDPEDSHGTIPLSVRRLSSSQGLQPHVERIH